MNPYPNPQGAGGHNKGATFPPEILTPDEVTRIVQAASTRSATGLRARALVLVMHRGGLRIAEALALKPKDVDTDRCTVRVLRGKGRKARTVKLDPGACAAVEQWLAKRAGLGIPRSSPLFCTLDGSKAIYAQQVRDTLKRLAKRAGVDKRIHPHGFRHAHAYHLMISGVPVPMIQRQLGHASLNATAHYLASLGDAETLERVGEVSWE